MDKPTHPATDTAMLDYTITELQTLMEEMQSLTSNRLHVLLLQARLTRLTLTLAIHQSKSTP